MAACYSTLYGQTVTYDQIGNPEDYRDGMSFTWNGRQMATANLNGTTVEYKYDADGLRNYKKVGNTVHEYEYVGGQLVYEKRGDLKFYYRYNAMGELASIKRIDANGTETSVYVVTNTRGDVEELRLASGTKVARYVYDTWGNTIGILDNEGDPITDTSNIAVQNPFRYRSYYYDAESGLYYLQSRYYDPVTCRFVNADDCISTGQGVLGNNMYSYCLNNPIIYYDYNGLWAVGIGFSFNATLLFGISISGSIVFDDNGNIDFQGSYAIPFVDNTYCFGVIGVGATASLQFNNADTVYDMSGYSHSAGFSVGSIGIDVVSSKDMKEEDATIDGFQVNLGVGAGVDIHLTRTKTISSKQLKSPSESKSKLRVQYPSDDYYYKKLTVMEKRYGGI